VLFIRPLIDFLQDGFDGGMTIYGVSISKILYKKKPEEGCLHNLKKKEFLVLQNKAIIDPTFRTLLDSHREAVVRGVSKMTI